MKKDASRQRFTVRPSRIKNILFFLLFLVLTAAAVTSASFIAIAVPHDDMGGKLFCAVGFSVSAVAALFLTAAALDSIRNVFSLPTLYADSEEIYVCKYGKAKLSEISGMEVDGDGAILKISFSNGDKTTLRKRLSNVPLETVKYAIELRMARE